MNDKKNYKKTLPITLSVLILTLLLILCLITAACVQTDSQSQNTAWQTSDTSYQDKYFNPDKITTLNIIINEAALKDIYNNAADKEWHSCDIELNGDRYNDVGIKTQGGMTLDQLTEIEGSTRFSFKFKADKYVKGQTFAGLDTFIIRNEIEDPSFMREYLSYETMTKLGIPSPLYAYAAVSINGKYHGLYLMVEGINNSFLKRNFHTTDAKLYQADGYTLSYFGDNENYYINIFASTLTSNPTSADRKRLINIIKTIDSGTNLESVADMDEIILYLAANTALVNTDNYVKANNYITMEKDGIIRFLPWDFDRSYGTHRPQSHGVSSVHFPIDSPVMTDKYQVDELPLLKIILSNEKYREKYHQDLRYIAENYLGKNLNTEIDRVDAMISEYVKSDPTKLCTFDEYKSAVDELKSFSTKRAESITGQLNGTIPSTHEAQSANPGLLP